MGGEPGGVSLKPDQHPPLVSVVVPTFKRADSVRLTMGALVSQDLPPEKYEVLVVDSTPDDSVERIVREFQERASCVLAYHRKQPEGGAASRNLGARHARAELIAFTDSDCMPTPGWLSAGMAALEDGVGIVQGRVLPDPNGIPGFLKYYPTVERESHIYECANVFYRRAAFEQAGGFSPEFVERDLQVFGGEDVDLAWRVKRLGWQTRFAPAALVHHEVRPISFNAWLVIRPMLIWPLLVRRFPELRQFMFARYFYDREQAALVTGLVGTLLSLIHPLWLLLWIPYILARSGGRSRLLRGPLRPLKALVYLPRDLVSCYLLCLGSIRARSFLL